MTTPLDTFPVQDLRQQFPILAQNKNGYPLVYLDNAATTQKPERVLQAVMDFYRQDNANIHRGVHNLSQRASEGYEKARERVRRFLGAKESAEIIFVRGATEGINLVAQTFGRRQVKAKDNIVITMMEHHSNIVPWQLLREEIGCTIRVVPCDARGVLDLSVYRDNLDEYTRLVSLVHVSNSLGTVNPVAEMIHWAHQAGARVLVDAAQSVQHLPLDVQHLDADFLVFSGHKIYGPTGIGVLYGKGDLLRSLPPWEGGGGMIKSVSMERTLFKDIPDRFEAGTPHIAGAIGLAAALDFVEDCGREAIARHEAQLLQYATEQLSAIPGLRLVGEAPGKVSVLSFLVGEVHPHDVGTFLDADHVAVRTGHHCNQPLMKHLGLPGTVRASLALYNTMEDIDRLVAAIGKVRRFFA